MPTGDLHTAYRAELHRRTNVMPRERDVLGSRLRRLDEQLTRLRQLYEYGEYDWDAFLAKRAEIQSEQQRLRDEAAAVDDGGDLE